jgi:3',5'-cyclic AMP phosphodiesterase CpdA
MIIVEDRKNLMKIAACSDIHWQRHCIRNLPKADILIVAGDFCTRGELGDFEKFVSWLNKYPAKHKIVVPGNHDMPLARFPDKTRKILADKDIKLLINELVEIEGLKIYGCSYSEWLPG